MCIYLGPCKLLENFTDDAIAQLYVTKFSTIFLSWTKLYVIQSFLQKGHQSHTAIFAKTFLTVQILHRVFILWDMGPWHHRKIIVPSIPLKSLEKLCHHLLGRGWKNDGMRPPRHPLGLVTSNDLVQYSDTTSTSSCLYKGKTISKHGGPDQWERDKLFIVFFKKLLKFSSLFYEKGIGGDI